MSVVRTDGQAYGHVISKISRQDRLPNFLRYGAPLARALHALGAPLWIDVKFSIFYKIFAYGLGKAISSWQFCTSLWVKSKYCTTLCVKKRANGPLNAGFIWLFPTCFVFCFVYVAVFMKAGTDALVCMKGKRWNYVRHFVADNGYGTPTRTRPVSISYHSLCACDDF